MNENITIIIPSYNPDGKLLKTITSMINGGFSDIIVVNDGSRDDCLPIFNEIANFKECTLLTHDTNKGKGRALKTAFDFCITDRNDKLGVITVDGDGQHLVEDVKKCADQMTARPKEIALGVRNFSDPKVPWKSRFGNKLTSLTFGLFCGIHLSDTQTGLRAIPTCYLKEFTSIEGERFEYETNMLLYMHKKKIRFSEVIIETVYLDENASTHFNPIVDSIKIYKLIFKYSICSGLSSLIDLLGFWLLVSIFTHFGKGNDISILLATIGARIISSLFNYIVNKSVVFHSKGIASFFKYVLLCIVQLLVSAGCVTVLSHLFTSGSALKTLFKLIVDTILFFISYNIQKKWVFK